MSPSKCKYSSPFRNLVSCSLLTFYLCSLSRLSRGNVIYGTSTYCLVACTIVGTIDGATLPLITFYVFAYVLSYSFLIPEPKAPPCSAFFFLLRALLGDFVATFFLFSSEVSISSLVLFTLVDGFYGFSFWWTNKY